MYDHSVQPEIKANPVEQTKSNYIDEFLHSAVYFAVQTPAKGLAQIADLLPGCSISDKIDFIAAPKQAQLGTASWFAQEAGGAVGTVIPFFLTNLAVGRAFKQLSPVAGESTSAAFNRDVTKSAISGFAFDSLLKPNERESANWQEFFRQRVENGAVGAATFASLTTGAYGVGRIAETKLLQQSEFGKSFVAPVLKNSIAQGLLSGLPAGLIAAEGTSYANERRFATSSELSNAAASMSLVGALFGVSSHLGAKRVEVAQSASEKSVKQDVPLAPEKTRQEHAAPKFDYSYFPQDNSLTVVEPGKAVFAKADANVMPSRGSIIFADMNSKIPEKDGAIILKNEENEFLAKESHDLKWERERIPGTAGGAKVISNEFAVATEAAPIVAESGAVIRATKGSEVFAKLGSKIIAEEGSTVRAYFGSEVIAKDSSKVKAFEGSKVVAQEGSTVTAYSYSRVIAEAKSNVTALTESEVVALDGSKIQAKNSSVVHALDGAHVVAEQSAQVHLYGNVQLEAKDGSVITARNGAQFEARAGYKTIAEDGSTVRAAAGSTVYGAKGSTVLAESGSKVHAGSGSEVVAKDGSFTFANFFSKTFAFEGSTVYAKPLSTVHAEAGSRVHAEKQATVFGGNGSEVFAQPESKIFADSGSTIHADERAHVRRLSDEANITDITDEFILSPVAKNLSIADEVKWMQRLSIENRSQVRLFMQDLLFDHGLESGSNFKAPENIESKAVRPSTLEKKPWHTISHIRDAFRFKTVLDDIEALPKIVEELKKRDQWQIVKVDVDKALNPGEWGWRIIAFDLRMPNGQLVEYYLPIKELEAAKKEKNHHLFEKWRNKKLGELTPDEQIEYQADLTESRERYNNAWKEGLRRSGRTEDDVRRVLDAVKALDPNRK